MTKDYQFGSFRSFSTDRLNLNVVRREGGYINILINIYLCIYIHIFVKHKGLILDKYLYSESKEKVTQNNKEDFSKRWKNHEVHSNFVITFLNFDSLYELPGAATTKYHNLSNLNSRNLFFHNSGGQKVEFKVSAGPCSL